MLVAIESRSSEAACRDQESTTVDGTVDREQVAAVEPSVEGGAEGDHRALGRLDLRLLYRNDSGEKTAAVLDPLRQKPLQLLPGSDATMMSAS